MIDWFDIVPPVPTRTTVGRASSPSIRSRCQARHGVYRDPAWDNGDYLPQDWIDFVAAVIERSRNTREHIEAPHQLENA